MEPKFFGTGASEQSDTPAAIREAYFSTGIPAELKPDVIIVFTTSRHDPAVVESALKEIAGTSTKIFGGYAVGVITNQYLGYDGFQIGILVIKDSTIQTKAIWRTGMNSRPEEIGREVGKELKASALNGQQAVLLLYDSADHSTGKYAMNMAEPFLKTLKPYLDPEHSAGAGLVGDMVGSPTFQWVDGQIIQNSLIALIMQGDIEMQTQIFHGAEPAGAYHFVTKSDGNTVLEIDGRPALDVIDDLMGASDNPDAWKNYAFFITLGINKDAPYSAFREDAYRNRLCLKIDKKRRGLVMFEPDLVPGTRIQLMRRTLDFEKLAAQVHEMIEVEIAKGRTPLFSIYIDCAGRAAAFAGKNEEEGDYVRRVFAAKGIPLLGFYSGVELGNVSGEFESLDWTGVLCIYSRPSVTEGQSGERSKEVKEKAEPPVSEQVLEASALEYYQGNLDRTAGQLIRLDSINSALNRSLKQKISAVELLGRLHEIDYPNLQEEVFYNEVLATVNSLLRMETSALFLRKGENNSYLGGVSNKNLDAGEMKILATGLFENLSGGNGYYNKRSSPTPFSELVSRTTGAPLFAYSALQSGDTELAVIVGRTREILPFQPPLDAEDTEILNSVLGFIFSVKSHKELQSALVSKEKKEARVEIELQAISFVQQSLLPVKMDSFNGEMAAYYKSADRAGGDWYYSLNDPKLNRTVFFLADVTGHGISAAVVTGVVCGAVLNGITRLSDDPAIYLEWSLKGLNAVLRRTSSRSERQATLTALLIDHNSKNAYYTNAGHPPPLMRASGSVDELVCQNTVLGFEDDIDVNIKCVPFAEDDLFFLFSDGLIENQRGPTGRPIRQRALAAVVGSARSAEEAKKQTMALMEKNWGSEPLEDDVTVIAIKV